MKTSKKENEAYIIKLAMRFVIAFSIYFIKISHIRHWKHRLEILGNI